MSEVERVVKLLESNNTYLEHMMPLVRPGLPADAWRKLYQGEPCGRTTQAKIEHRCHYCGVLHTYQNKTHCQTCGAPR